MPLPPHPGLRNNRHMVSVIRPPGRPREVLGVAWPDDVNPRLRILEQWGIDARSPRRSELASIDIPLPRRTRAILSYRVDPALRDRLNTGLVPPRDSRLEAAAGLKARIRLGPHRKTVPI